MSFCSALFLYSFHRHSISSTVSRSVIQNCTKMMTG
ncbi:hypothetical protein X975_21354, partial [Stegodyphus mimosarum]